MREGKYFERELPAGYRHVKTIDAKDKKTVVILNLISLIPAIVSVVVAYFATGKPPIFPTIEEFPTHMIALLSSLVCLVFQTFLRLFLYGAVYKFFTREKLTFGRVFGATYCGVPQIYLYRKPTLVALLTPFVLLSMINLTLCFVLPTPFMKLLASMLFGAHIGACSGFLWESGILIFKLRDNRILIKDDGPKQTFFVPDGSDCK